MFFAYAAVICQVIWKIIKFFQIVPDSIDLLKNRVYNKAVNKLREHKMKKQNRALTLFILPVITLILQILPFGAVCNFAGPYGDSVRQTYSCFSLIPYGYGNLFPMAAGILNIATIVILAVYAVKSNRTLLTYSEIIAWCCFALSFCPLYYGMSYMSVVGVFIGTAFAFEAVYIHLVLSKNNTLKHKEE